MQAQGASKRLNSRLSDRAGAMKHRGINWAASSLSYIAGSKCQAAVEALAAVAARTSGCRRRGWPASCSLLLGAAGKVKDPIAS